MKFGIFYELQLPRPWAPDDERQLYQNALSQVERGCQRRRAVAALANPSRALEVETRAASRGDGPPIWPA